MPGEKRQWSGGGRKSQRAWYSRSAESGTDWPGGVLQGGMAIRPSLRARGVKVAIPKGSALWRTGLGRREPQPSKLSWGFQKPGAVGQAARVGVGGADQRPDQ